MPDNKKNSTIFSKSMERVNDILSGLYGNTYNATDRNKKLVKSIATDMDRAIRDLTNSSIETTGTSMSHTIGKIVDKVGDAELKKEIDNLFSDNNKAVAELLDVYMDNKHIYELDKEIDTICLYMPLLEDALEEKQNNILSGDIFTRDYINMVNTTAEYKDDEFASKMTRLKDIYRLTELIDRIDFNTMKYGESFVYVMPYVKEFEKMLQENSGAEDIIKESFVGKMSDSEVSNGDTDIKVNVEFSKSTIPRSILEEGFKKEYRYEGIGEANEILRNYKGKANDKTDTLDNNLVDSGSDGFVDDGEEKVLKSDMSNVKGCIIKEISRDKIIPLYIEDTCLGFYMIEDKDDQLLNSTKNMSNPMDNLSKGIGSFNNSSKPTVDPIVYSLADKVSEKITSTFVNSNTDVTKELYLLLKQKVDSGTLSDYSAANIKVTYIEPEHMIHWYYKKNPVTNRGVSDLYRSLFPAKFYICMSIGIWLGILTRSQDKRAFFVKQRVDTNISKVLMNTIKHIKMGNFGMREINNINTILNITGKFHDYIIPESDSGERPINFEVIDGQRIETYDDALEKLKKAALGPTKVPLEMLEERERVDFATQLNIANSRFVNDCKKRQLIVQERLSALVSRIFNYEYKNETFLRVQVMLPPPKAQRLSTITEIMRSVDDIVNKIMEVNYGRDDEDKKEYKIMKRKLYRQYMATYLDVENIDKLKEQSRLESKMEESSNKDDDEGHSRGRGW